MKTIDSFNFNHTKALMRVDFNVPLNAEMQVTDNTRIKGALPSIQKILSDGGSVVLMSHLGRPKNGPEDKFSLRHVAPELSRLLGITIQFVDDCIGEKVKAAVLALQPGQVLLLENVRFYPAEQKGDTEFARQMAELGCTAYVNDAFGTAHRPDVSVYTVAQFFEPQNRMFGYLMAKEVANAQKVIHNPQRPFTAILGGAKVSDKILLIDNLLGKVNNLLIGGGMAYTFLQAQGGNIGKSLVEPDKVELAAQLLKKAADNGVQLLLPDDSIAASKFDNEAETQTVSSLKIPNEWMGLDIGPIARQKFATVIAASKTIFWNGPMGVFEMSNFSGGTHAIAQAVALATQNNGAFSLIGGGDSVAAINQMGLQNQVSYVSTGGGAMLELLEGKDLPGIQAIG
ncbi:phosphoglycerate kinase [Sphingobacteriales bacterium UPWRP_1]|nr:phosphoglycerate kinase [Sphingobacteriales bacterium TSM_CSS]PSJ74675.1 phosphoglycerate kinase [Sphingobacteriales bacterium UPWRP_1]